MFKNTEINYVYCMCVHEFVYVIMDDFTTKSITQHFHVFVL